MGQVLLIALAILGAAVWPGASWADYESMPLEQKVAVIDANTFVGPKDPRVTRFRHLLESLHRKTGESKQSIADRFVVAEEMLRTDFGKDVSILFLMNAADKSEALAKREVTLTQYLSVFVMLASP